MRRRSGASPSRASVKPPAIAAATLSGWPSIGAASAISSSLPCGLPCRASDAARPATIAALDDPVPDSSGTSLRMRKARPSSGPSQTSANERTTRFDASQRQRPGALAGDLDLERPRPPLDLDDVAERQRDAEAVVAGAEIRRATPGALTVIRSTTEYGRSVSAGPTGSVDARRWGRPARSRRGHAHDDALAARRARPARARVPRPRTRAAERDRLGARHGCGDGAGHARVRGQAGDQQRAGRSSVAVAETAVADTGRASGVATTTNVRCAALPAASRTSTVTWKLPARE